jgi:hypothetical protein
MAHYAFLDDDNVVTQVIVGRDEDDLAEGVTSWEDYYGNFHGQTCKRTSYNTLGNEHRSGGTPFRGNYAGIGFTYDEARDAFIPPSPFPSWSLDDTTLMWEPPEARPDPRPVDGEPEALEVAVWDEDTLSWVWPSSLTPPS